MRISALIDSISDWTGRLVCWLIIPQILALVYEVISRYIFNSPTLWSYDVTYMIYGTHYLMGAGYTLLVKGHIKVDIFYNKMPPLWQAIVHLVCYLIFFFPVIMTLTYEGVDFAYIAWAIGERSLQSPWRPVLFPFKGIIAVSFFLLFLQGTSEFIRLLTSVGKKGVRTTYE